MFKSIAKRLSVARRRRLGRCLAIISLMNAAVGIILVLIGIYVKVRVDKFLFLLDHYSDTVLPGLLMGVGILMCLIHTLGGKACINAGCRRAGGRDPLTYQYLTTYLVCLIILACLLFVSSIVVITHKKHADAALHKGRLSQL